MFLAILVCGWCLSPGWAIDLTKYTYLVSTTQQAFVNGTFDVSGTSVDTAETDCNFGGAASRGRAYRSLPFNYDSNATGSPQHAPVHAGEHVLWR